jgi:hypothetical protein
VALVAEAAAVEATERWNLQLKQAFVNAIPSLEAVNTEMKQCRTRNMGMPHWEFNENCGTILW